MPIINLSNGKSFASTSGQTLLESAKSSGLVLEHSCRTGRCGVCKARVLNGETGLLQNEEALTQADISNKILLTCCRTALSDVDLNIEDLGELAKFQPKTVPCRIDSLNLLSTDVMEVTLRTPSSSFRRLRNEMYPIIKG